MPYASVTDLPDSVKKLTPKKQRQWMAIWNSSYARCAKGKDGDALKTCETAAFKQANGVVQMAEFAAEPDLIQPATFALEDKAVPAPLYADDEMVYRSGLLFRAGDYPDKAFAMTPEELQAAVEAFGTPVAIDLEHTPTILEDRLGELVSVEASDDGTELHGIVALPRWLDAVLPERKVSATWDRATKTLAGLALVRSPRVTDAALMAAFAVDEVTHEPDPTAALEAIQALFASAHATPEGLQVLQELHNTAARGGAVCKAGNAARMASAKESSTIQKVHDMTVDHGIKCSTAKPGSATAFPFFSIGSRLAAKGASMSRVDEFVAWLKGDTEAGDTAPPAQTQPPKPAAATAAMSAEQQELDRMRRELEASKAETRRIRAEAIEREAVAFAAKQIADGKAFPAEHDAIVAQFVHAATVDNLLGKVKFGEGDSMQEHTGVELLQAEFAARPSHKLTTEQLQATATQQALQALANMSRAPGTGDKPPTQEETDALLAMTTTGRATLAARAKNGRS